MNIIYLTDIHGAFSRVYTLLRETVADLYVISGDLLDMPFYSLDRSIEYYEIQNYFHDLRREAKREHVSMEDYVQKLMDEGAATDEMKRKAGRYLRDSETARETMLKKYTILGNIFSQGANGRIVTIPGGYDMDPEETPLSEWNIHRKKIEIGGYTVAGYGGSETRTPGFPEKHLASYREDGSLERPTDLFRFLDTANPDIIVAHHPAHGVLDRAGEGDHLGSEPLRTYCDTRFVTACLTGQFHEAWGVIREEGTLFLNPSNFGEVITGDGSVSEGGFFYEFEVHEKEIPRVSFKKLVKERVVPVAEYTLKAGKYGETVVDRERYAALKSLRSHDSGTENYTQIPELRIFRDIRNFFRIHQTRQSEERILRLEAALESLGGASMKVAMDLVGSVNMGMAQDSSDVDAVLYVRGEGSCGDDFDECSLIQEATERVKDYVKGNFGFEVIDFINLDMVEDSILSENFDCDMTQRFAAYRSICRPVNYAIISPVEDLLNENMAYRKVVEEHMRTYLRVLTATPDIRKSFDKYVTRLRTMGVEIPKEMMDRIELLIQRRL